MNKHNQETSARIKRSNFIRSSNRRHNQVVTNSNPIDGTRENKDFEKALIASLLA